MRIGLIGAGNIGGTLARHFVRVGHEVVLSNSRGPESLAELIAELGERAQAATAAETAGCLRHGRGLGALRPLPRASERRLAGKVVIDTNNYYPQRDGHFEQLDTDDTTSSELLQQHLPAPAS